jgi:hypothetical protein
VGYAVPAGNWEMTVAFDFIGEHTVILNKIWQYNQLHCEDLSIIHSCACFTVLKLKKI